MTMTTEPGSSERATRTVLEDVTSLRTYVSVVETQGISSAARRLQLTPSTVSKHLSLLEERLGMRLINRTTRRLSITDVGARLYERALRILQELEAAEAEILDFDRAPKGRLRVTAAPILSIRHIGPHLSTFTTRYPEISLEVMISGQLVDLVNEGIDVAIRIAADINRHMQSIRLAPIRRAVCASPDYLAKHGAPETIDDLQNHNCLLRQGSNLLYKWTLRDERGPRSVRVEGSFTADNTEIMREAVLGGIGVALMPTFVCWQDLLEGRLVEVLPGSAVVDTWLFAVVPHRRHMPSKTRAFIDFVKEAIGDPPHWDAALATLRPFTPPTPAQAQRGG